MQETVDEWMVGISVGGYRWCRWVQKGLHARPAIAPKAWRKVEKIGPFFFSQILRSEIGFRSR